MIEAMDHILIVDDDADIRDLLSEYLEKQGFRVSTAADGRSMRMALGRSAPEFASLG